MWLTVVGPNLHVTEAIRFAPLDFDRLQVVDVDGELCHYAIVNAARYPFMLSPVPVVGAPLPLSRVGSGAPSA